VLWRNRATSKKGSKNGAETLAAYERPPARRRGNEDRDGDLFVPYEGVEKPFAEKRAFERPD